LRNILSHRFADALQQHIAYCATILRNPERFHVIRHWTATEMQRTTTQMRRWCTIRTTELNDINRGRD
jgi:hypothetical protein